MNDRNATRVAVAAGSSTTGYTPASSARGACDRTAFSLARAPIAPGSIPSTPAANVSANPLPPSPPVMTVVSEACVEGAQQNWPSEFATPISIACVS